MLITETDFLGLVNGYEKSFVQIFQQYYKTLVSFAMRYGLQKMEAEDVVIETFHRIWQIRSGLKSPGALHTLLFTAVKNRSLDTLRKVKNRRDILGRQFPPEENNIVEPNDFLIEEEVSRLLDAAIAELPPQCRRVILSLLAGKSLQEIADEMQISVNSVKTYRQRAIESLRKALEKYPFLLLVLMLKLGEMP